MHSDCVVKHGHLPSECLKHYNDDLPEECKSLRKATFECKRGMVGNPFFCPKLFLFKFFISWI